MLCEHMRLGYVAEDVGEVGIVCQEAKNLIRREAGPQAALDGVGSALRGSTMNMEYQ